MGRGPLAAGAEQDEGAPHRPHVLQAGHLVQEPRQGLSDPRLVARAEHHPLVDEGAEIAGQAHDQGRQAQTQGKQQVLSQQYGRPS